MSKIDSISRYETIPPQANDFPIKIRRFKSGGKSHPHWHEHLELLYFTEGNCRVIVGGKIYDVSRGDLIIVNSGEIHSFSYISDDASYYCTLLYPDFFKDVSFGGILLENRISNDKIAEECITELFRESECGLPSADMMQKSLAYRLVAHLIRSYAKEVVTERERAQHEAMLARLNSVLSYVADNYSGKLTTSDLAGIAFLSEGHFCRFFKSATGRSAMEYINEYRVDRAAALLLNTSLPLSQIASDVGFDDQNYFSRVFKKIKGMSPSEFRVSERAVTDKNSK